MSATFPFTYTVLFAIIHIDWTLKQLLFSKTYVTLQFRLQKIANLAVNDCMMRVHYMHSRLTRSYATTRKKVTTCNYP